MIFPPTAPSSLVSVLTGVVILTWQGRHRRHRQSKAFRASPLLKRFFFQVLPRIPNMICLMKPENPSVAVVNP